MIVAQHIREVNRSAEEAFDVIGTHMYDNHPKWEDEVVEIRPITEGPVRVGSRAVMVRREFGRTTEVEYVVTEFEPGRRIASDHVAEDFSISFDITPIDNDSCEVQVEVQAQLQGWIRVLEPIMRLAMPRRGARIMDSLVEVIESSPART